MSEDDAIIKIFRNLADDFRTVKLINAYRGIPILYDARVTDVQGGTVVLDVNEYQAVCLSLEGKTHIMSARFPEVLRANTVSVDILQKQATLTGFVGVGRSPGNRSFTRVQPKQPLDVEIQIGDHQIGGQVADISLSGIGVFTFATYAYGDLTIEKNAVADIRFTLPPMDVAISLSGQVTSTFTQPNTSQRRIGLRIMPDAQAEQRLLDYVAARRDELMRELSVIYDSMRQEAAKQV